MGFLDHSTNNIIIDAVLTDRGRELLARNDGSFEITKFAFGDDEVDYTTIKKFGRTVGKEKIEKNTPILEAQTAAQQGIKYKCFSVSNPFLTQLPKITTVVSPSDLNATTTSTEIQLQQQLGTNSVINDELQETFFFIDVNNRFLSIDGAGVPVVDSSGMARYSISRSGTVTGTRGSKLRFTIRRKSLNNPTIYAAPGTTKTVKTILSVIGRNTGSTLQLEISIDYSTT